MNGERAGTKPVDFDRSAASDLRRNTLSQIPSLFGRLAYFSSLRNPNGTYKHHGLALIFGQAEANRALKDGHLAVFAEWLSFNLEQQKADLDLYLADCFEDKRTLVETLFRLAAKEDLIPASVRGVERRLFLSDLTALMELFRNVVANADPDA